MDEAITAVRNGALFRAVADFIVVSAAVIAHFVGVKDQITAVGKRGPGAKRRWPGNVAGKHTEKNDE